MIEVGPFALEIIFDLLIGVVQEGTNYKLLEFFERRKIKNRIENATAEVVEPLLPFLVQEKVPEDKQRRLLAICVDELRPLTQNPARLFQGSLDGQKIFEELYAEREIPEEIVEDGLRDVYALLCPRIATLLCKIPAAVKDWENEAWTETYSRLDDIITQLRTLLISMDELATLPSQQADEILAKVRRSQCQKVRFELDLTGLRSHQPQAGKFDNFFIHPEIKEPQTEEKPEPRSVGNADESFPMFTCTYRPSVVIGTAGAGKSTWAKWLQLEAVGRRWTGISVRVELRGYSNEELPSLQELIREIAGKHQAEHLTAERIDHWLKERQVIFILDGFDEIPPADRDKFYEWIVDLQSAVQGCPFIVTSRLLTTDHLTRLAESGWQDWEIQPFDDPRIVDYIARWYAHTPLLEDGNRTIDSTNLATSWRNDPTIEPLTGNPLLLSTLLMVHHLDGSLPSGRSQLYQRYIEGMLGLWDNRRRVSAESVQLTQEQKRQIIRALALKLFFAEQDQLDETDIVAWLEKFLQIINISHPASEVLDLLRERSGLIVGPGIYSFAHKSIAEFLVAEAIFQGDQRDEAGDRIDRFLLFEHRDDDRWNTVTFLWAGLAPVAEVEAFIEACLDVENWLLGYGVLCDQYDRIPIEIRRSLLLQSSVEELTPTSADGWYVTRCWPTSQPVDIELENIEIILHDLRGLSSYTCLEDLIKRAVKDSTIKWSDYEKAKGLLQKFLRILFVLEFDDIDLWKACLESQLFRDTVSLEWLYRIAERVIRDSVVHKTLDLANVLAIYQETCPHYCGFLPIALISNGFMQVSNKRQNIDRSNIENVGKILVVLPDSDQGHVVPEWLVGTRDWILASEENIGDLLTAFIDKMEELVQQGYIERDAVYNRAIDFVRKLQDRREALNVPA